MSGLHRFFLQAMSMVKKQMLSPIKTEVKGNLYLKGDVLKNKW